MLRMAARLHNEWHQLQRWCLALLAAMATHPLLDGLTIYGTQLLQPFTDEAFGVGSMFIIDPLYTLPLLAGVGIAARLQRTGAVGVELGQLLPGVSSERRRNGLVVSFQRPRELAFLPKGRRNVGKQHDFVLSI